MTPTEQRIDEIIRSVSTGTGIPRERLCGRPRRTTDSFARFILCHELKGYGLTLQAIGKIIGRSHGTVRYNLEQYHKMGETSRMFRDMVGAVDGAGFDIKTA
jgi:chromosomal replication initiation ATPase DnaA